MSNLSLKHRELLKEIYEVGAEAPVDAMRSVDGTVKYLYRAGEGHFVEAVAVTHKGGLGRAADSSSVSFIYAVCIGSPQDSSCIGTLQNHAVICFPNNPTDDRKICISCKVYQ